MEIPKNNSEKSTSGNENWFWSGDGERMAQKYTDPGGRLPLETNDVFSIIVNIKRYVAREVAY